MTMKNPEQVEESTESLTTLEVDRREFLTTTAVVGGGMMLGFFMPLDTAAAAGMPVLALTFGALGLLFLPLANAYSRWRESMADDFALRLSQKPEAFASAMTRLANQNLADADPEPWVVWLLHSHPPLRERIARAKAATG